ncbi:hypothetical protein BGW42_007116 [Actinomortierella wolfii]|nr:hypothetical protein BGW42_007116 [Actinomortierella wolfii]
MSAILDRLLCVFNPPKRYDEPKDWPQRKKNIIVLIIAYCAFTAPLGNSIFMPAAVEMQRDFDTTPTLISASVSVYVLVIGILPMFWASLCDYMGRRPIYIISLTIAIFGSIGCALAKSIGVFLAMRVFLGLGSSSVVAVGGGTLSDVFHPGERGTALGLFYLGPLVSPIVGPLVGGVLAEVAGWRSTMWFMLSCVVLAWLLVVLVLPETHRDRVDGKIINPPSSTNIEELSNEEQPPTASPSAIEGATIDRPPSPCTSEAERTVTEAAVLELRPTAKEVFTTTSTAGGSVGEGALASPLKSPNGSIISAPIEHKQPPTDSIELADRSLPKGHVEEQLKQPGDHVQESTPTPNNGSAQSPSQKKPRFFNPLRPLICLKHRINILAVMFNAFGLGGQVCLINTIPVTFHDLYHLSESKIGLSMMSLGCGLAIGSVLGGRYSDFVVRRWLIKQERLRNLDCENPSSLSQGSEGKMKLNRLEKMSFWLSKKKHGATTTTTTTTTTTKEGGHKDQQRTKDGKDENGEAFKSKVTVATRTPPEVRLRR